MTEVFELKPRIVAKVIAFSICVRTGQTIITYELEYQRFIHAEFMTHREFSRNAMSSRAIPIKKMIEQVRNNPAKPVHWGKNQPGMQANEELTGLSRKNVELLWEGAAEFAALQAETMDHLGAHKQVANRILEPFQYMKTVMTTTSLVNWNWLRDHEDADPTIRALAVAMIEALEAFGEPTVLKAGEWHMPYVNVIRDCTGKLLYLKGKLPELSQKTQVLETLTLEEALMVSSSCCAQVSYRLLDETLEKAIKVYDRLVNSIPVHASPFEHQATPIAESTKETCNDYGNGERYYFGKNINQPDPRTWQEGITHVTREGKLCSGNFTNFIQHRQLIPNNVKRG